MIYKNKRLMRFMSRILIIVLALQIIDPIASYALTSGPTQPEVQSFEPVGTTDMVDLFTGDFVYNIPLLDVEGYPINIAYHSGSGMEDEASWVGFGWNINPGAINRSVRGLPDDFDGENITKTLHLAPEENIRAGVGLDVELFGAGAPLNAGINASLNGSINISNYRGVSVDLGFGLGAGVNIMPSPNIGLNLGVGINAGVGSQSGADVGSNYTLGLTFKSTEIASSDLASSLGFSKGTGYNTRTGVKATNFSISSNSRLGGRPFAGGPSFTKSVPIGLQNYVPIITNSSKMNTYSGQIKLGVEMAGLYSNLNLNAMVSKLEYEPQSSRKGFGYFYAQNGNETSIMDFTRDKDGTFNESMHFLPLSNMTYDVYSVTGQGTGGAFRPYRNDFGSVFDPAVSSPSTNSDIVYEVGGPGYLGYAEGGANITHSHTVSTSGPWSKYKRPFTKNNSGSIYENIYLKQAGEATETDSAFLDVLHHKTAITGVFAQSLPQIRPGTDKKRVPRGELTYYLTGKEAALTGVPYSETKIVSFESQNGFSEGYPGVTKYISRVDAPRKSHHISEIVQVKMDGRKYVYGLPAMNVSQKEETFSIGSSNSADGLVNFSSIDASTQNGHGPSKFYSATQTPPYAHSYLLTSVLSDDYADVTGNGPSDDDLGSYTKFNYSLKNENFKWKAPYADNKAQYDHGFKSDPLDDKASVLSGSREQWYLHSIESKNYVAEFFTSKREDARGAKDNLNERAYSYKLDSIKLYNKHDRFINKNKAVPIKTIIFSYDYSLCQNVPNNLNSNSGEKGKLTLKKIFIRYGNSDKNMISPYQFFYASGPTNYSYNVANKDRWGMYKPSDGNLPNSDFPFVNQNDANINNYATAWALSTITLPSGGKIHVQYESDDYAYVQDKSAMEMFYLTGIGDTTLFRAGSQLYIDKHTPQLYLYFKRRKIDELPGMTFKDIYLKDQNLLYYNFDVEIRKKQNGFEPIKGYAEVLDIGVCPNNEDYGYIRIKKVTPLGGDAELNPISYMTINFARYYLPQVIFPGNDPYSNNITNVLTGLKYAFTELLGFAENPVKRMIEEGRAKQVNLATSYMRLTNPGRNKKGGGSRVKQLTFNDQWDNLAGGNSTSATYGKRYKYTIESSNGSGKISSGVASYEPQIGTDENPFHSPVNYSAQSGNDWPPMDPVGLYQDLPLGETLYPSPIVGYSQVTVTSIHQNEGRSSQDEDVYNFYTAKDFPIEVNSTPLNTLNKENSYGFIKQKQVYEATQGYTLIFNDMHGKPSRVEHRVILPNENGTNNSYKLISYKQYNYFRSGNRLKNEVPVIKYDVDMGKLKKTSAIVGYEEDITIDSRSKKDETHTNALYVNLNVLRLGLFPLPIPYFFPFDFSFSNEFSSVVATKVVQQYGLLESVQIYDDGALTTIRNEAFDPITGHVLTTSINNEYQDKEYTMRYPAWWGYQSMGPSYENIGFTDHFDSVSVTNYVGILPTGSTIQHYRLGDELLLTTSAGNTYNVWVTGFQVPDSVPEDCEPNKFFDPQLPLPSNLHIDTVINHYSVGFYPKVLIKPRYKYTTAGWTQNMTLKNVRIKVIRSGNKNQLDQDIQSYTGMTRPFQADGSLTDSLKNLIRISAQTYSDRLTAILPQYDSLLLPTTFDSLNEYLNGTRGIKRIYQMYTYQKPRDYSQNRSRHSGLFSALTFWRVGSPLFNDWTTLHDCWMQDPNNGDSLILTRYIGSIPNTEALTNTYLRDEPNADPSWVLSRTITKYSPWGYEIENKDAIGNYTSAQYGYNNQLPVAIAQNAQQHDIFTDNFEDYRLLQVIDNKVSFFISPFMKLFGYTQMPGGYYGIFNIGSSTQGYKVVYGIAHTGDYALLTPSGSPSIPCAVATQMPVTNQPRFLRPTLKTGQTYVISYWFKPVNSGGIDLTTYSGIPAGYLIKSNIIDGWQQIEQEVTIPSGSSFQIGLPGNAYVDDIRVYPIQSNLKSFVYNAVNQRLVASLDENNFATLYEYDQEGNLIRTKKETEKGIMTTMESRSANPKTTSNKNE